MKICFFTSFLIVLLTSCSSTSNKSYDSSFDEEFSSIENSDFNRSEFVKYNPSDDEFDEVDGDALSTESLDRVPENVVERVSNDHDVIDSSSALCRGGRYLNAFKKFDKDYKRYRKNPSYWNQVGTCFLLKRDYSSALIFYNKARDLNKKYIPALNNIGVLYQLQGKSELALQAYRKAFSKNNFSLTPLFNMSQIYLENGILSKALRGFRTLYKINSNDKDVLRALAYIYLQMGSFDKSYAYFLEIPKKYLALPSFGLAYSHLLFLKGEKANGKKIFYKVKVSRKGLYYEYYKQLKKEYAL